MTQPVWECNVAVVLDHALRHSRSCSPQALCSPFVLSRSATTVIQHPFLYCNLLLLYLSETHVSSLVLSPLIFPPSICSRCLSIYVPSQLPSLPSAYALYDAPKLRYPLLCLRHHPLLTLSAPSSQSQSTPVPSTVCPPAGCRVSSPAGALGSLARRRRPALTVLSIPGDGFDDLSLVPA